MNSILKRALSLLLVLVMCISFLPASAFAEDAESTDTVSEQEAAEQPQEEQNETTIDDEQAETEIDLSESTDTDLEHQDCENNCGEIEPATYATSQETVSISIATTRLNELIDKLNGLYFTVNQQPCNNPGNSGHGCDNCKMVNVVKQTWIKNLLNDRVPSGSGGIKHYYYNDSYTAGGYSCYGFANFAGWYIFADNNSSTVSYNKVIDGAFNYSTMQNAHPGDILRFGANTSSGTHSAIFVSCNSSCVTVLDCNTNYSSNGNCKVRKHTINYNGGYGFYYVTISRADNYDIYDTFNVSFNSNGGAGNINPITLNYLQEFTIPAASVFSHNADTFLGWNLYRQSDNTWYVTGEGWKTDSEITQNGYTKKLYPDQEKLTLDDTWINGSNGTSDYTFYAVWDDSASIAYLSKCTSYQLTANIKIVNDTCPMSLPCLAETDSASVAVGSDCLTAGSQYAIIAKWKNTAGDYWYQTIVSGQTAYVYSEDVKVISGTCGDNLTWTLDDEWCLTISGTGNMADYKYEYPYSTAPWGNHMSTIKTIDIKSGVTSIGDYAFHGHVKLTSVTIPEGITSIGNGAFYGNWDEDMYSSTGTMFNNGLTSVSIPSTVTSIAESAFWQCYSMETINVSSGNTVYTSVDGVLYDKAQTTLLCCPGGRTQTLNVPTTVTTIGRWAFHYCTKLEKVILPDGLKTIERFAFFYSESLTEIELPESLTYIGGYAFQECNGLQYIMIPKNVTLDSDDPFSGCSSLEQIDVDAQNTQYCAINGVLYDKSVTKILCCPSGIKDVVISGKISTVNRRDVNGYNKTVSVTIQEGVQEIRSAAFSYCYALKKVYIPASVTKIASGIFSSCNYLTDIYYGGSVSQWNSLEKNGNFENLNIHVDSTPQNIFLSASCIDIQVGARSSLKVSFMGYGLEIPELKWTSSDESIVTVINYSNDSATLKGISEGSAVITVSTKDGKKEKVEVTVSQSISEYPLPTNVRWDPFGTVKFNVPKEVINANAYYRLTLYIDSPSYQKGGMAYYRMQTGQANSEKIEVNLYEIEALGKFSGDYQATVCFINQDDWSGVYPEAETELYHFTVPSEHLAIPTNIVRNGNILSWPEVEGADAYCIELRKSDRTIIANYGIETNFVDLTYMFSQSWSWGTPYTIKVSSISNNPTVIANSDYSEAFVIDDLRQGDFSSNYLIGDLNKDGLVNIEDVHILRKAAAGLATLTAYQVSVADVYADGRYNALDVNLLRRCVAGIVTELPYTNQ